MIFQSGIFLQNISDHSLEMEKGRYNKTPCEERLCKNCGVIEDEAHFNIMSYLCCNKISVLSSNDRLK
jgi:hypothetical protein